MTTEQIASQLELVAQILRAGHPWEYTNSYMKGFEINRSIPLTGRWNPNSWEPCHKPTPQPR